MDKMWAGRFMKALDNDADDFNSSIHFDCKMYRQDIKGSMAHALMLAAQGIISRDESSKIIDGLSGILDDLQGGKLQFDMQAEDIHMFVESVLTERIGDTGKRLHTARSRNDQVALDIRMYLRDESADIIAMLKKLIGVITDKAESYKNAIMPGYTHLQRAQPIVFAHQLLAYGVMFSRDITRISDAVKRMNYSPLGSCALAGTTYNTDRQFVAQKLGFDGIMKRGVFTGNLIRFDIIAIGLAVGIIEFVNDDLEIGHLLMTDAVPELNLLGTGCRYVIAIEGRRGRAAGTRIGRIRAGRRGRLGAAGQGTGDKR